MSKPRGQEIVDPRPAEPEIPYCIEPVWDGPYRMECGHLMPRGECIRHGRRGMKSTDRPVVVEDID